MNPIEAVASFFGNYFKFSGRATRSEYWWCNLIIALAYIILVIVMVAMPIVGIVLYFVMIIGTLLSYLFKILLDSDNLFSNGNSVLN